MRVHLGTQFGDAVFVGVLHFRLARDQPGENVVTESKISCSRGRPHAERRHGADHDPEHHRSKPDLFAGVDQGVAILSLLGGSQSRVAGGDRTAANGLPWSCGWC